MIQVTPDDQVMFHQRRARIDHIIQLNSTSSVPTACHGVPWIEMELPTELPVGSPMHVTGAEHAISHPKHVTSLSPALLAKPGSKGNFGKTKSH